MAVSHNFKFKKGDIIKTLNYQKIYKGEIYKASIIQGSDGKERYTYNIVWEHILNTPISYDRDEIEKAWTLDAPCPLLADEAELKPNIPVKYILTDITIDRAEDAESCSHVWKTYIGFRTTYDYCMKCDEKRKR